MSKILYFLSQILYFYTDFILKYVHERKATNKWCKCLEKIQDTPPSIQKTYDALGLYLEQLRSKNLRIHIEEDEEVRQ